MLGLAEIAVIGAIVLFLLLAGRSRSGRPTGAAESAADVWEARATIRIPKYLAAVLLALAAGAAVAGGAIWLQFPSWVGALAGGIVAGAGAVAAMQQGRRSDR